MPEPRRPSPAVLSGLPDELLTEMFAAARHRRLQAGGTLFLAGDPGDGCYLVAQGLLKVTMTSAAGAERILAILGPGAVVGELSMIDGAPRSSSVCALKDSELSFLSRGDFAAFAARRPDVYRRMTELMARRLRETNLVVAAGSFLSLKGRVARAVLTLADAFGNDVGGGRILIRQRVNQHDLAAMSGIARENVNRIVNDWRRKAVVSRVASYYCVEDRDALARDAQL